MSPEVRMAVERLRSAWDEVIRSPRRRAVVALLVAALFATAHLARVGTPAARIAAAAVLLGLALTVLVVRWREGRRRGDLRHVVRAVIGRTDPELGAATLRAMSLADRTEHDDRSGSPELARLHLGRLLGRASVERVTARAEVAAGRWAAAALGLAMVALGAVVVGPFRVVEGLDVLVAHEGRAPLPLAWLGEVRFSAKPPAYLGQSEHLVYPFSHTAEPRGTVVTVSGEPLHPGRTLVLTDGVTEQPFLSDGAGGVVAHFTVADSADLVVAARFGRVLIPEPDRQSIRSISDLAPKVILEGAPRTATLLDEPDITIAYEATDDHGLGEVDLVLRSGTREERRVLSRPMTGAVADRGGIQLHHKDTFFRQTFVPVRVTVEARDNDGVLGPKWGKSEAIIIIPPQVGEAEARRIEGLTSARDALTDLLADRLLQPAPEAAKRKEHLDHETEAQDKAVEAVHAALVKTYGGLRVDGRVSAFTRGQLRRLEKAQATESAGLTTSTHEALAAMTENVLLAFDSGLRALADRDARKVAKRLAEVADDAAAASEILAAMASEPAESVLLRLDVSAQVLDGGGKQLLRLGDLGADLGEIVAAYLRRIARAREAHDYEHARLAAQDLAARLRKPFPSFSGGGGGVGSGSGGGTESGAGAGASGEQGEGTEADAEQRATEQAVEDLVREHAGAMNDVGEALEKASSDESLQELRDEAKKHAEAIREAVKNLPPATSGQDSAESSAARGRQQAEAMAGALERGQAKDAVEAGRDALEALEDARKRGEGSRFDPSEQRAGRESARAKDALAQELAFAEKALSELRRRASQNAKEALDRASAAEKRLSDKARSLRDKGESGDAAMPEDMLGHLSDAAEAMREAARAFDRGDGEAGHAEQERAQRLLEMARGEPTDEGDGDAESQSAEGKEGHPKDQPIPGKSDHKGPDEFRRRVLEGLGNPSDSALREAIRRYAESLLR